MRRPIEPVKKVVKMLRSHRRIILNYFRAKERLHKGIGIVNGFHNKRKVGTGGSDGFRSAEPAQTASYHALGDLPTPPLAMILPEELSTCAERRPTRGSIRAAMPHCRSSISSPQD